GVEHLALPCLGVLPIAQRAVVAGAADKSGKQGGLREVERARLLVEVDLRRGGGPDGAVAERNVVEVHLEDLALRVRALDLKRQECLTQLAVERRLVTDEAQLDELLRDRRGALDIAACLPVHECGADDAKWVDAGL